MVIPFTYICKMKSEFKILGAGHSGTCLQSQVLERLRQENHLTAGFQGHLAQHSKTPSNSSTGGSRRGIGRGIRERGRGGIGREVIKVQYWVILNGGG